MFPAAVHRCDIARREIGGDASCLAEEAIRQEHLELCAGTASNCSVCGYVWLLVLAESICGNIDPLSSAIEYYIMSSKR